MRVQPVTCEKLFKIYRVENRHRHPTVVENAPKYFVIDEPASRNVHQIYSEAY